MKTHYLLITWNHIKLNDLSSIIAKKKQKESPMQEENVDPKGAEGGLREKNIAFQANEVYNSAEFEPYWIEQHEIGK